MASHCIFHALLFSTFLFSSLHFQTLLFLFSLTLYVCVCVFSVSLVWAWRCDHVCVSLCRFWCCVYSQASRLSEEMQLHTGANREKKNSTSEIWTEMTYRALRKKSVQREQGSLPLKVSLATDAYIFIENILRRYLIWSGKFFIYLKLSLWAVQGWVYIWIVRQVRKGSVYCMLLAWREHVIFRTLHRPIFMQDSFFLLVLISCYNFFEIYCLCCCWFHYLEKKKYRF